MPDTIDGTIQDMRALDPASSVAPQVDGQVFRARGEEVDPLTGEIINRDRIDTFVWDPTPYSGPKYDNDGTLEVLQLVGFAPDIMGYHDGSGGVWKWVNRPRGFLDAGRIYGLRPTAPDDAKMGATIDNRAALQRCIDEVLLTSTSDAFPYSSWRVLLPSGDLYVSGQIRFNLYDGNGDIIQGGHTTFEGHGRGRTRLIHNGPSDQHAFLMGDSEDHRPPGHDGASDVGALVLQQLDLVAATDATEDETHAVLRLWQGRGSNILRYVTILQNGTGHGLDGSDVFLGSFEEVSVIKGEGPTGYTGRGLWLHTEEAPFYVSGEFMLGRISAFGP